MTRTIAAIASCALLLLGCSMAPRFDARSPEPLGPAERTALELRNDDFVARTRVAAAPAMPADCDRHLVAVDQTSIPATHLSRSEAEARSAFLGDGKPARTAVLGRVTMTSPSADFRGNPIDARLVWILSWTGLMHRTPSSGPYIPNAPPPGIYYSTASVLVIDALSGDLIVGIACGIVRV